jgi:ATP adenylyltransferase
MSDCCFCSNLVSAGRDETWNHPLLESRNFLVFPSLGSLIEGWLLVVPKEHYISMGALSADLVGEMEQVKNRLIATLSQQYGELCAFEHGPARPDRMVGCGVDHAHLHLVPLSFDLREAATTFMPPGTEWEDADWNSCRTAFEQGRDYLYIEQPIGRARITTNQDFGSQVFRRAIANRLGVPDQFRWQDYPQKEIVANTIRSLSSYPDLQL